MKGPRVDLGSLQTGDGRIAEIVRGVLVPLPLFEERVSQTSA